MKWSPRALEALDDFLRSTPPDQREAARARITREAEAYCTSARIPKVASEHVVIGLIRSTPMDLRGGLRSQLAAKGFPVDKYEGHFQAP